MPSTSSCAELKPTSIAVQRPDRAYGVALERDQVARPTGNFFETDHARLASCRSLERRGVSPSCAAMNKWLARARRTGDLANSISGSSSARPRLAAPERVLWLTVSQVPTLRRHQHLCRMLRSAPAPGWRAHPAPGDDPASAPKNKKLQWRSEDPTIGNCPSAARGVEGAIAAYD